MQKDFSRVTLLKGAYEWFCKFQCEMNGAQNLSLVSTCLLNEYKECDGHPNVQLKSGFTSVVSVMYEKLDNEMVRLNHVVEKIDWTHFKTKKDNTDNEDSEPPSTCTMSPKIKILCNNREVYYADHVVVTIPLGCLKKQCDTIFVPRLSESKIKAIESVGFGTVNKIFLLFKEPFWDPGCIFHVIWDDAFDEMFQDSTESYKTWLKDINRFAYTSGHPQVLCAWVVGEGAVIMENLPKDEVMSNCMELLEKIMKKELPKPEKIYRTKWHSDRQTYGSYSYLSTECDEKTISEIAKPEFSDILCAKHPVLLFAGEATHPSFYSTVHGAYESGIREARTIIEHYRNCALSNSEKTMDKMDGKLHTQTLLHENMKILVIGAGIAGLAAAFSLYEKGFTQISVLEAQDYIGGRVFSLAIDDNILELGAQWIHGSDNPLYEFASSNNLLCDSSDEPSYEGKGIFCTSDGKVVEMSLVKEVKDMVEKTKSNLEEGKFNYVESKSAESFFLESFNSYISSYLDDPLNSVRKGLFNWYLKYEVIDNSCDNLDEVAVQGYSEWCDIPDELYHINFKKGCSSLVNALHYKLPAGCLYLKKPIKSINWKTKLVFSDFKEKISHHRSSDDFPVLVECEDGEDIAFDAVVLTTSVGYVKENMDILFKPPLPDTKARAFSNTGFGTINKIFLIYNVPFWNEQDKGFQLVWTNLDEDLKVLLKEHPWTNGITGFDIVQKQPNVLLGWIGGVEAKMMESVDADTVGSICTKLLRKFLNSPNIPYPTKTFRSSWFTNKYIRGAYSYRGLKFCESDSRLEDLQMPLFSTYEITGGKSFQWPVVYFAGEALDENSFSTVHGAFQSGLKVADDIDLICSQIEDIIDGCEAK